MRIVLPILCMVSLHAGHFTTRSFLLVIASLVIFFPERVQLLNVAAGRRMRSGETLRLRAEMGCMQNFRIYLKKRRKRSNRFGSSSRQQKLIRISDESILLTAAPWT
jgi:hypothetical protein